MNALFIDDATPGISRRASVILLGEDTVMKRRRANHSSTAFIRVFMNVLIALAILAQPVAAQTNASYINPDSVTPDLKGILLLNLYPI
jgi:hypothetical protein